MAIEKIIEIVAEITGFSEAESQINSLTSAEQELADATDDATESQEDQNKAFKKSPGIFGAAKNAAKGFGTALKGLGIGLIVAVVGLLTQALSKNQKVVDVFSTLMNAAGIIVDRLVTNLTDTFKAVNEATGGFDALGKVLGGFVTLAINQVVITFSTLKLGILNAQLLWENSFLGGKDPETISELEGNIESLTQKIVDTAKESFEAGKKIVTNIGEAVGEVIEGVQGAVGAISETVKSIDKSTIEQASNITKSVSNFALLEAQANRIKTQYENQIELAKQLRDDDTSSIEDRVKANEDLGKLLEEAAIAEKKAISNKIGAKQKELALDRNNKDLQAEIFKLNTELLEVDVRLGTQRSEQLTQTNSLLQSQIDLDNQVLLGQEERARKDIEYKLEKAETTLEELALKEQLLELDRQSLVNLDQERLKYAEGTAERIAADEEYFNYKAELAEKELKQLEDQEIARQELLMELGVIGEDGEDPETMKTAKRVKALKVLNDQRLADYKELLKGQKDAEEKYAKAVRESQEQLNDDIRAERLAGASAGLDIAKDYADSINSLTQGIFAITNATGKQDEASKLKRAKRQFKINKALQLVMAGINIAQSITTQLAAAPAVIGVAPNPALIAALISTSASGAAQIATIAAAKFSPEGGGSVPTAPSSPDIADISGPSATSAGQEAPDFNLFGQANEGSTAGEVQSNVSQQGSQTIKAYVTESDITQTQERLNSFELASEL